MSATSFIEGLSHRQAHPAVGAGLPFRFLAVAVSAFLTACGGGGGSDSPQASEQSANVESMSGEDTASIARLMPVSTAMSQTSQLTGCDLPPPIPAMPSNVILVRDHGARGDDDVDDTTAIQAAINAAKSGQWVVFPSGRYIQSRTLVVNKPGVTLWGQGATLHASNPADQAIMLKADGTRVYGFTLTAATEGRRSEPWTSRISAYGSEAANGYIRGIVIQNNRILPTVATAGSSGSNGASAAGILMVSVRDFSVVGNTVERSLSDGIHITGASQNGRVLNNQVRETGDDMIAVVSYLDPAWRTKIKESSGWLAATKAKTLVKDILISRNDVSGQYWGRGISVVGGEGVTISRNTVSSSAMGGGILVAREESSRTHGVNNIWVEGNVIRKIQTVTPAYVPSGPYFLDLSAKTAVDGGRTGQGGIEIHNISAASDINDTVLYDAVKVTNVLVRGNDVSDVLRDAIRVAADSQPGSISGVVLQSNRLSNARVSAMSSTFSNGTPAIVQCDSNSYAGAPVTLPSCMTPKLPLVVTGAALSCAAL